MIKSIVKTNKELHQKTAEYLDWCLNKLEECYDRYTGDDMIAEIDDHFKELHDEG